MLPLYKQHYAFDDVTTVKDEDINEKYVQPDYFDEGKFEPLDIKDLLTLGAPEIFMEATGSNTWAVSGRHTESGKTLLSTDPHL